MKKSSLFGLLGVVVLALGLGACDGSGGTGGGGGDSEMIAAGTPVPEVVDAKSSAITAAGTFCTQGNTGGVGNCLSPGYPVAFDSFLCNGAPQTIYGAFQQLNPSGDHVNYIARHLPMSPTFPVHDGFYLDCATIGAQQHGTGLPYYDQAEWNLTTILRGQGSLACNITRYWPNVGHTVTVQGFFNFDIGQANGSNNGTINGVISTLNGVTDPSIGLCYSSYPVSYSF